jgi:hypothetical protein
VRPATVDDQGRSRVQAKIRAEIADPLAAWGLYNSLERRYELYYPTGSDGPTRALYFTVDGGAWPQTFPYALTGGEEIQEPANSSDTQRYVYALSSNGTSVRFDDSRGDDDGTTIDARYRSHVLHPAPASIYEAFIDVASGSTASFVCVAGSNFNLVNSSSYTATISASSLTQTFVPVYVEGPYPTVEIRNGATSKAKIAAIDVRMRAKGRLRGGA